MDFPDKKVPKHKTSIVLQLLTLSNWSEQYVGRNQLDAATLDRFITFNWKLTKL
jgi:hypothetical protein